MPRGEDMTGFLDGPCKHLILFFGSGGRVVICSKCSHMWESTKPEAIEIDLNEDDKRIDPSAEAEPQDELLVPLGESWETPHHGGCMGRAVLSVSGPKCENPKCCYPAPVSLLAPTDEDDVPF